MNRSRILFAVVAGLIALPATLTAQDHHAMIKDALSAATPAMGENATVMDWENNVLKQGDNGWVCFPTPPTLDGTAPMCLDEAWLSWADAWMNKKPVNIDHVGIAYMLGGDGGASNSDPYAEGPTDDWVVAGPHLMIIAPDPALLSAIPTDPDNGGPWIMWSGTEYAHVMVPLD